MKLSDTRDPLLDGVRGLAILAVLAFHLRLPGATFGWAGVNLFFVLSGYLITRLLVDSRDSASYFRTFYARRSLRIFPIYFLTLAAVTAWGLASGQPVTDLGWYVAYLQNYLLGATDFRPAFPGEMGHTWSLAVEEQFYFLWPAVVWALAGRRLLLVTASVWLLGVVTKWFLIFGPPGLVFTALPSQMDALAGGAFVALALGDPALRARVAWAAPRVLVVAGSCLAALALTMWPWNTSMIPTLPHATVLSLMSVTFAAALAAAVTSPAGSLPWLRTPALTYVGRISYGLYLYHWPVILLTDQFFASSLPATARVAIKLAVSFALAVASWHLLESPLNALKSRFRYAPPRGCPSPETVPIG